MKKSEYLKALANHSKTEKKNRVTLLNRENRYSIKDGNKLTILKSTQYYNAVVEACQLYPNSDIVLGC